MLPAVIGLARIGVVRGDPEVAQARLEEARRIAPGHPLVERLEREIRNPD